MTPDLFDRQSIGEKFAELADLAKVAEAVGRMHAAFTRRGDSIVPPTPDELARERRDHGMQRAADHAGKEWQDRAVALVRWYAGFHPAFMTEQVREMAELRGLKCPGDGRSWGAVMMRAAREKIVRPDGYAPANSSNGSPKRRWASLVG